MTRCALLALLVSCKTKHIAEPAGTGETGGGGDTDTQTHAPAHFTQHLIAKIESPVWAAVGDLDGDGKAEIVVSSLGTVTGQYVPPGVVDAYTMGATPDEWTPIHLVTPSAGVEYPNQPTLADVDGDGKTDVILPSGGHYCDTTDSPCGSIRWLENQGGGSFLPQILFDDLPIWYSQVAYADVDGDSVPDLVATAEYDRALETQVHVIHGLGGGTFDLAHKPETMDGGGALLELDDVDGDGDLDVLTGETFDTGVSFWWFQNQSGAWLSHTIATGYGPGWQIGLVPDLYGDGALRAVATNHTITVTDPTAPSSVVLAFEVPSDPTQPWPADTIGRDFEAVLGNPPLPVGAPGSWAAGDVDGDGDIDVVVSGGGDPHLFLLEQTAKGEFTPRLLIDNVLDTAGTAIADLDGDGVPEIVAVAGRKGEVYVLTRS